MLDTPFSPWPSFTTEEIDTIADVLRSNRVNYWTGTEGRAFEDGFADFAGTNFATAFANGTVALELALKAVEIKSHDEVIVSPRTYIASVTCLADLGARPVFVDLDRHSQNLCGALVESAITKRTKAIICVHHAGWPCEMTQLRELAREKNLTLIEDCAQAHGARYRGQSVGSIGDIGAWSFCQDKIMTTGGEGGMGTTNNRELWSKMWSLKDHGKSYEAVYEREHPPGFRWVHESFGTNGRMTEMQAAIGRIQLKRMPDWHRRRLEIANAIWTAARQLPGLRVPEVPEHIEHAAYRCYVFVRPEALKSGWSRDRIMAEINQLGVPCYSGSCPEVYLEKAFDGTGFRPAQRLPVAKQLGETSLAFLCHPTLTETEVGKTCEALEAVMQRATK